MIYIHVINKFTSTSHVPRGYAAEYVEALNELEILSDLWRFGQRNSRWDGHRDGSRTVLPLGSCSLMLKPY